MLELKLITDAPREGMWSHIQGWSHLAAQRMNQLVNRVSEWTIKTLEAVKSKLLPFRLFSRVKQHVAFAMDVVLIQTQKESQKNISCAVLNFAKSAQTAAREVCTYLHTIWIQLTNTTKQFMKTLCSGNQGEASEC